MSLKGVIASILAGLLLIVGLLCLTKVPTGHTGVVTTFGKVENYTFTSGLHLKSPFQKVVKMDNRTQKVDLTMQAFSKDIQQVDVVESINFRIDQKTAQDLYKNIGRDYYETVIYPRILEGTKAIFTQFTAENLVANRAQLSTLIMEKLSADVKAYGIEIVSVNVEDVDFTDAYTNAVEKKQVAQQELLEATTKQEQLVMEKNSEAARQVIDAKAAAEVKEIDADAALYAAKQKSEAALYAAQKEAEGNKLLQASITAELIKYQQVLLWDGKLPQFISGGANTYPVLTFD